MVALAWRLFTLLTASTYHHRSHRATCQLSITKLKNLIFGALIDEIFQFLELNNVCAEPRSPGEAAVVSLSHVFIRSVAKVERLKYVAGTQGQATKCSRRKADQAAKLCSIHYGQEISLEKV
jgi:hypothetical protein